MRYAMYRQASEYKDPVGGTVPWPKKSKKSNASLTWQVWLQAMVQYDPISCLMDQAIWIHAALCPFA